jgi:hypothetical protein
VPGVAGPYDDADIYSWNGTSFSRLFDASAAGLSNNADVDGLRLVDADTFYVSFNRDGGTTVPGLGSVADEDIVLYDAGVWSMYFDGSDAGLGDSHGEDVDAFHFLPDGTLLVSTVDRPTVPGVSGIQDEDLMRCVGSFGPDTTCTWSLYFDGSLVGLGSGAEDVDGAVISIAGNVYLTTGGDFSVSGLSGQDEDVFVCNSPAIVNGVITGCASFSLYFGGSASGLSDDLDGISLP